MVRVSEMERSTLRRRCHRASLRLREDRARRHENVQEPYAGLTFLWDQVLPEQPGAVFLRLRRALHWLARRLRDSAPDKHDRCGTIRIPWPFSARVRRAAAGPRSLLCRVRASV